MSIFVATATGLSPPKPRRIEQGSPQQETFWSFLVDATTHLILEARAGTGKSTSCREGMHRIAERHPSDRCAYVAFNRSIAQEFGIGLPSNSTATTMHAAGYAALRKWNPNICEVTKFKLWNIAHTLKPQRSAAAKKVKAAAIKLAGLSKSLLIGHDAQTLRYGADPSVYDRLCSAYGIDCGNMRAETYDLVPKLIKASLDQTNIIDYNDMVWLPVILDLDFPSIDYLFVDEAQDLDPCQHALVRRMAGDGRLIAVGDPYQAIYAFRGADSSSMATLGDHLARSPRGLDRLPLTMTRRCPTSHVALAARIVPDFEALPEAPEGEWQADVQASDVLEPGVLAVCRANAPLVSAAFGLAARGVPVGIQGRDIGDGLAKFVEDFEAIDNGDLSNKLGDYRASEVDRLSQLDDAEAEISAVIDRVDCVYAVMRGKATPSAVALAIRQVFKDVTPENQGSMVVLSSIHRAKGREADRVAILAPESMPSKYARTPEAIQQELNLIYVAATRSKQSLSFCGPLPEPLQ